MTVDLRTRTDGPRSSIDPDRFFGVALPAAFDAAAPAIAPGVPWLDLRPFTMEVDDSAWTMAWADDHVEVTSGRDDRGACVRLTPEQLDDLVADQGTMMGFWTSGKLDQPAGRLVDALNWWLVLRAALDR